MLKILYLHIDARFSESKQIFFTLKVEKCRISASEVIITSKFKSILILFLIKNNLKVVKTKKLN